MQFVILQHILLSRHITQCRLQIRMLFALLPEPSRDRLPGYAKNAFNAPHTGSFKISLQYLFFALLTIAGSGIQSAVFVTAITMILLLTVFLIMAVAH